MPTLGNALDFAKYEARNIRGHQLGAAPSSPVTGQLYYNTGDNTLYWWDGTAWVSARGGASATPPATTSSLGTIQLAGDLAGTAASPQIAANVITDVEVVAANKDGAAGTASMRTLGTGAQQAAPGNDTRFSDARVPTAHHLTHEPGGADAMAVDAAVGTGSLRTLGMGAQQALPGNKRLDQITAPLADLSLNGQRITLLMDPSSPADAATKLYVDNLVQGLSWKNPVLLVATTSIAGGGAPAGAQTIDGVAIANGDRVLLTAQTNAQWNGIWLANTSASWNRAADANTSAELVSAAVYVTKGTAGADTAWVCTTDAPITVDTTPIAFAQFTGAAQLTAGAGLTKTGNSIDVGAGAGITVAADTVGITAGGVTDAMLATAKSGYYSTATHGAGTTITITQATHTLRASRGLIVQCQVDATGAVVLPDIAVASNGDVTITFGVSQTANTIRTTIVG